MIAIVRIPIRGWMTKSRIPSCNMAHILSLQSVGAIYLSIKVAERLVSAHFNRFLFSQDCVLHNPTVDIILVFQYRESPEI